MRRRSWLRLALPAVALSTFFVGGDSVQARGGLLGYEQAYVLDQTVTVNVIEVRQVADQHALADFYQVVYPLDWQVRGLNPQCKPCDHDGQGIDFIDFHDHVLDSMPSAPGHGEFSPLWRVLVVIPAYDFITSASATHSNQEVSDAMAAVLPVRSEEALDTLLTQRLPDGAPVAIEVDIHHYFICSVVGAAAAR